MKTELKIQNLTNFYKDCFSRIEKRAFNQFTSLSPNLFVFFCNYQPCPPPTTTPQYKAFNYLFQYNIFRIYISLLKEVVHHAP